MTSNRRTKKLIRNHMESTGLCYLEARRALESIFGPLPGRQRFGQLIAVTSPRGGMGKSTVATGLATYLGVSSSESPDPQGSLKVLLLDFDVRDGQIGFFTGHSEPTILQLLSGDLSESEIQGSVIHDDRLSIDLLLAPGRPRRADQLSLDFYRDLLSALRLIYDYIIIDCPSDRFNPFLEEVVYPASDLILLVTDTLSSSVSAIADWIGHVRQDQREEERFQVRGVLNRVLGNGANFGEVAQGVPLIGSIPSDLSQIRRAIDSQRMDLLFESDGLRVAFGELARRVVADRYSLTSI